MTYPDRLPPAPPTPNQDDKTIDWLEPSCIKAETIGSPSV